MTASPRFLLYLVVLLVAAGTPTLAATQDEDANADVLLLPDELHLVEQAPGASLRSSVWLINTGAETLSLTKAKGSCGCTTLAFSPTVLPPLGGLEIPLSIRAPKGPGIAKTVKVTVTVEGRPPLRVPVRIETAGEPQARPADVVALHGDVDLGTVTAGEMVSFSTQLVNNGDTPHLVQAATAGCKCTRVIDFTPATVLPGDAFDVQLEIDVPKTVGRETTKEIRFVVEGQGVVRVPVRLRTTHPTVDALKPRAAELVGDEYELRDYAIGDGVITAIAWIDRQPEARVTFELNDDGSIKTHRFDAVEAVEPS